MRPEVQTPVESRSIVRTLRRAGGFETYVGRVTGTGSHSRRVGAARRGRPAIVAGRGDVGVDRGSVVDLVGRRLGEGDRTPGALLPHHQPAGDQPGDEQRRPGSRRRPRRAGRWRAAATHGDEGEQEQGQDPATAPGGRGSRPTARGVLLVGRGGGEGLVASTASATAAGVDDEPGHPGADRLAAGQDPHAVGEPVDRATPHDVVVVTQRLGDQIGGPGDGQGHEDESAQVHDPTLGSRTQAAGDVNRCVAKSLL